MRRSHQSSSSPSPSPADFSTMFYASCPFLFLSDRTATLILSFIGATANFYATYKLLTTWFSIRWTWPGLEESEWEGMSWKIDTTRALGAIVCAYFFVGGIASIVGIIGVLKRRTSNLRLFRDYSIADLVFGFSCTAIFALVSTKPVVRSTICEELSRQPDLLRSLSDSAGLNVENCESFLDKATVGVMLLLGVVLFIRLQFTLTVLNYYTHLRRAEQANNSLPLHARSPSSSSRHSRTHSRSRSSSQSQRILLLSQPLTAAPAKHGERQDAIVYAPVRLSAEQVRGMNVREAIVSLSAISEDQEPRERSSSRGREGAIRLPVREGEAPWSSSEKA